MTAEPSARPEHEPVLSPAEGGSGRVGHAAADQAAAVLERRLLTRALASADFGALHLHFDAAVLARYRERGAKLVRTRSVGRITMGQWSLDVGIAPDEASLHVAGRDLLERLPDGERAHWVEHLAPQPASAAYLQMSISPVACIDDGDTQAWD